MPTITPTPDEQAQIDQLLKEYDPERHPSTARVIHMLNEDYKQEVLAYMRGETLRRIQLALAMNALCESVHPTGDSTYRDGLDALVHGFDYLSQCEDPSKMSPRYREIFDLFNTGNWEGVIVALDNCMSAPARAISEPVSRLLREAECSSSALIPEGH